MSWTGYPRPPQVPVYLRLIGAMREFFFSPRVITRDGGGSNVVDELHFVGEGLHRLAAAVEEANRQNRDGQ